DEQLRMDVATAFISVMRARQQRQVAKAAVERATAEEESASARVAAGGALRTAALQASIDRRSAELLQVAAEKDLAALELDFQRLVGVKPPDDLKLPAT